VALAMAGASAVPAYRSGNAVRARHAMSEWEAFR
jgi:hypothetical protein